MLKHKIYGKANSNVILLIHGALVTQSMWKYQTEFLKHNFKVVTCNLSEHGGSPAMPGDYTVEKLVDSLIELINFIEVDRLDVCGHSLGGMVAQYFTYRYPERVKHLILAETAFGTKNNTYEKIMTGLSQFLLRLMTRRQIIDLSVRNYGNLVEETRAYLANEMRQHSKKQILRVMSAALNYQGKIYLNKIKNPTLILVGEDNKTTHRQAQQMNREIVPSKLVFISHASHLLNLDNPNEFNRQLKTFISNPN